MTSQDWQKGEEKEERELDLVVPLMRQSSIYSLTLDEIQNKVCEPGQTFGSMNMDEFLANIWNVEEGQIANAAGSEAQPNGGGVPPPPQRQGSITIPLPLCRKTVDEVWAEIHRCRNIDRPQQHESNCAAPRQPTLGEMTLEDFLIKAGVVREGYDPPPPPPVPLYGVPAGYQVVGLEGEPVNGQVVGVQGYGDHQVAGNGMYEVVADGGRGYAVKNGFGGRVRNGYGGTTGAGGSPASPGSEEWVVGGQVDKSGRAEGGGGGNRGRKRALEKVVERRQRRMIKNRESAARSRARKQC